MDCSMLGLPVHHQLPELAQTHVHELVMPSNHLILCRLLLLLPSVFPSIRVFSNESVLRIKWPKYWSFSFSISPSNEYSGLISFRTGWMSSQSKGLSRVFSNSTVQNHQFFSAWLSALPCRVPAHKQAHQRDQERRVKAVMKIPQKLKWWSSGKRNDCCC